jgi:hypothetical protein
MRIARLLSIPALLVLVMLGSCRRDPLARITVLDNPSFNVTSRPRLLAAHLNNPMSPRLAGNRLVVAESGAGRVSVVENEKTTPVISGFVIDQYDGYNISAEGITVDPSSGLWIITAAEGSGRVFVFNPSTFPTDARKGRVIPLEGAVDDNPFTAVLAAGGRILAVSGGTKSSYQGSFDAVNPGPLKPVIEVETGLIGLALDLKSGDVFGAVFGKGPGTGEIVRWDATKEPAVLQKVAAGLTNPVDVAFTKNRVLLSLEFGEYGSKGTGKVSIVATDGSGSVTPFIVGLNNPSGLSVGSDNTLFITEFGETKNSSEGTLISLKLAPRG